MICALVIGRAGSTGFPGKNLYPVLGRPLVAYPLLAASTAESVDRTYMSTDSAELAQIAREHGAQIIERPPHLADARALGEHAFAHGYEVIRDAIAREGETVEMMVLLFANAPTITSATIDRAIATLRARPELDSAITVSRYNMWSPIRARRINSEGLLEPLLPPGTEGFLDATCDRDSTGDVWFADQGVSVVRPRCLERLDEGVPPQRWMGRRIFPIEQWGGLDVDYEWQLPLVDYWLLAHGFTAREKG